MNTIVVKRRTFEAAKYPKGSPERARLNEHALTSEYMPSYRYVVLTGAEDLNSPRCYRTKAEAGAEAERLSVKEGAR